MRFAKQAVDADGHRRAGQRLDHCPVAARGAAKAARFLNAMCRVENNRYAERLHLRDRPQIVHEPAIAEECAPLAEQDVLAAGAGQFIDNVPHVAGRHELALLHVNGPASCRRGHQQIGLPREERRHLQERAHLANGCRLLRLVDIGRDRQTGRLG